MESLSLQGPWTLRTGFSSMPLPPAGVLRMLHRIPKYIVKELKATKGKISFITNENESRFLSPVGTRFSTVKRELGQLVTSKDTVMSPAANSACLKGS